jgi:shikimate kinase
MEFGWIALSWFMWSGKTSVWELLAKTLWKNFIDVDKYILEQWKTNEIEIGLFIEQNGIGRFRKVETQAIQEILWMDKGIIGLWWWAVTIPENVEMLKKALYEIVYLDYPFEILAERLQKAEREWKAGHRKSFNETEFRKLYDSRQKIYESTADIKIQNNLWKVQDAVNLILEALK